MPDSLTDVSTGFVYAAVLFGVLAIVGGGSSVSFTSPMRSDPTRGRPLDEHPSSCSSPHSSAF